MFIPDNKDMYFLQYQVINLNYASYIKSIREALSEIYSVTSTTSILIFSTGRS